MVITAPSKAPVAVSARPPSPTRGPTLVTSDAVSVREREERCAQSWRCERECRECGVPAHKSIVHVVFQLSDAALIFQRIPGYRCDGRKHAWIPSLTMSRLRQSVDRFINEVDELAISLDIACPVRVLRAE